MLVTCKCHGKKIEQSTAYCVRVNGRNTYYCSESDYIGICKNRELKKGIADCINEIYGYEATKTSAFNMILSGFLKDASLEDVLDYLRNNKSYLKKTMSKSFGNEYGKAKYFVAVLRNNLGRDAPQEEIVLQSGFEMYPTNYVEKPRRPTIDEIERQFIGEDGEI